MKRRHRTVWAHPDNSGEAGPGMHFYIRGIACQIFQNENAQSRAVWRGRCLDAEGAQSTNGNQAEAGSIPMQACTIRQHGKEFAENN